MGQSPPAPGDPQARFAAYHVTSFPLGSHLTRVLFVGDSLSLYTGYFLSYYAARYGVIIGGRRAVRLRAGRCCAVQHAWHAPRSDRSVHRGASALADRGGPTHQVVAVVVGWWETMEPHLRRADAERLGDLARLWIS